MTLHRAWAILDCKALDASPAMPDERIIEGIASHISPDSDGDIIMPKGVSFRLPIPLLMHHDPERPIGEVFEAVVTDEDIRMKARIPHGDVPAYVDEAWLQLKAGLVKGLSIGFQPLAATKRAAGEKGLRILKWAWRELSAVTIPAHQSATVLSVKAASGVMPVPQASPEEAIARAKRAILASNRTMRA
jgi:HK97 family phage prohead protease